MQVRVRTAALRAGSAAAGLVAAGFLAAGICRAETAPSDPNLFLEEARSPRALAWVGAENERTRKVLEADPRFKSLYTAALAIDEAKDRIPVPRFLGGEVYNFWQDAEHVRGLWRKTSLADYETASPHWTAALDLDAYAKAEGSNWFSKGQICEDLHQRRCLVALSEGGEDAVALREFDLGSARFVEGGFRLPKGKQDVAWEDEDSLLLAREWRPGELTRSGYPYVVKRLPRGGGIDAAVEIFRGDPSDVSVTPVTFVDGAGERASFVRRGVTFFESETYLVDGTSARRLGLPKKSTLQALLAGRLILSVDEPWSSGGVQVPAGALVSVELSALRRDPERLVPTVIFAPGPRQSLGDVAATKEKLVVTSFDNVRGRAAVFRPEGGGWAMSPLQVQENATIGIVDADLRSERAFVSTTGFLTPSTLALLDAGSGAQRTIKALPPRFDAAGLKVEQFEATSSDGVKIPYFLVGRKSIRLDGSSPTILNAYGGFQVSETPAYSGIRGKLWLERGGAYVLANIRGGGEFGPAWHEAGLKTRRQIIYDDFAAVAEDLIRRGVTSPRRLGIQGGSNGGLLMGVEMTQRPDLWRAVDIEVPLLDMLRYESIAAGASWVGEYGSVSVPQERAFLEKISPYANLKAGVHYPEPFIWSTTRDDRVGPQHARKFAARLKALGQPYLYYEVTEGGHGSGANLKEQARTQALEMTYFTERLMD